MWNSRPLALLTALALAASVTFAAACGDDGDDGEQAREDAADLAATYENFERDLADTGSIEDAPDDIKDSLKDDCGTLQDEIDSDDLDEFCDDLSAAIDDENQTDFEQLKGQFQTVSTELQDEIASRISDAAEEGQLEGGDPGNGDDNDEDDPLSLDEN